MLIGVGFKLMFVQRREGAHHAVEKTYVALLVCRCVLLELGLATRAVVAVGTRRAELLRGYVPELVCYPR